MSKAIFKLRNKEAIEKTTIFLHYKIGRIQKLVYSTGETIKPDYWDIENQIAFEAKDKKQLEALKGKPHFDIIKSINENKPLAEQLKSINLQLSRYKNKVFEIESYWKIQKIDPTIEGLRVELDKEFKKIPEPTQEPEQEPEKTSFFEFIENFISTVKLTRSNPPKPINFRTLQKYRTVQKVLQEFSKKKRKGKLDFENIDLEFYQDFIEFLQKQHNHAANTVGKYIRTIKVFLKEATEAGINTNHAFESKKFAATTENVEHINLTETELDLLWNLDLSHNKPLEAVRDLFIISCYTGLRFQDFTTIVPENIIEGTKLKIFTKKTGKVVVIPLHWRVAELLARHENQLPRVISNQKMNEHLKNLGKIAGINENVETVKTKGGLRVSHIYKKYELITCHTGRRSFATNLFRAGVPAISIMKLTGHTTEAIFMKYINVSADENADLLMNHDFFTKGRMRAI